MKILQINTVSSIRSTGRVAFQLHEFLKEKGINSYFAYSFGPQIEQSIKIGNNVEKKIEALFSRITGLQGYTCFWGTNQLIDFIKKIKPDVIHFHNIHSNFLNYNKLFKYIIKNNIPIVITLHDCWFYTGKCTHYTVEKCYKWQQECYNCPKLRDDIPSWFFDKTKKMFNDKKQLLNSIKKLAVVGPSDWVVDEAKKSFLNNAKIMQRIYNPINTNIFKPVNPQKIKESLKIENKFVILGVASQFTERNGLYKFIELGKLIDDNYKIILIGNISGRIKLSHNIIHVNEIHNVNEMPYYYSMADVYINFAIENTFGYTTIESLACGTPVIVYSSTSNDELVQPDMGYKINVQDNINEIFNCIIKIQSKSKNCYSLKAIEYVKNNFEAETIFNQYLELYNKLLQED